MKLRGTAYRRWWHLRPWPLFQSLAISRSSSLVPKFGSCSITWWVCVFLVSCSQHSAEWCPDSAEFLGAKCGCTKLTSPLTVDPGGFRCILGKVSPSVLPGELLSEDPWVGVSVCVSCVGVSVCMCLCVHVHPSGPKSPDGQTLAWCSLFLREPLPLCGKCSASGVLALSHAHYKQTVKCLPL